MTKKELEQINKIENNGYIVLRIIEVEGYKCAVIAENGEGRVEVVPFDENKIYPKQCAILEWNFLRYNKR